MRGSGADRPDALLLVAVLLVAINLRGAIAAVSPVLQEIRTDLGMSGTVAALLTTVPVLCFAVVAPVAAWLGGRLGLDRAILLACLVIAAGTVGRVFGGSWTLLVGTLVVGAAITVGNVLVPVVAKRDFPTRASGVTALLTAALCTGAALTAALTAPVAAVTNWRIGLASWAALAVAAALVWQVASTRRRAIAAEASVPLDRRAGAGLWRSWLAWAVAAFLGAQAAAYYVVTAWLPTLLIEHAGTGVEAAGAGAAAFQFLGIAGTLIVAAVATVSRLRATAVLVASGWTVMLAGLLWLPAAWPVWILVGGVAQGAGIALAMMFVVVRAYDELVARGLSAMTQLVGYAVAATGPLVAGALYEWSAGWALPLVFTLGLAGCMALTGVSAGREATVGGPAVRRH